jgi:hypothetical protein
METKPLLTVPGTLPGVTFNVVIVEAGTPSPRNKHGYVPKNHEVEFYDARHMHTPLGQFVSSYHINTLIEYGLGKPNNGLDLMGYEPSWKVSAAGMAEVFKAIGKWVGSR